MDLISNLIEQSFKSDEEKIKRLRYMPYNINISKHVWNGLAKEIIGDTEIKEQNANVWTNLIKYVHGDDTSEYDLKKAISLTGRTGSGKTKTMQIMSSYIKIDDVKYVRDGKMIKFNYKIVSSREIVKEYTLNGYDAIEKYSMISNLCIDDLGSEEVSPMYYGTTLNVMEEIIETRYTKNLMTHFTSNFKESTIEEVYGSRVHSRYKAMCNIIVLNDRDFRIDEK